MKLGLQSLMMPHGAHSSVTAWLRMILGLDEDFPIALFTMGNLVPERALKSGIM